MDTLSLASADPNQLQETLPPTTRADEAETDIEVLRTIPEGFQIDSEQSANWLVRKVISARVYAERVKSWADQESRRARREEECLLYMYGRQLEAWVRAEVTKLKGRRKS